MTSAPASSRPLSARYIVLGVTGSIACYKAVEVASRLVQAGAIVDVAMTPAATQFIRPLTFRSLTQREPYVDMFSPQGEYGEAHVELARRADLMLIAPATASTLGRLAHGIADDFVSLTAIATQAPLLVAPAMDAQMWDHPAVQANRETLLGRGVEFVGPTQGRLASGRIGSGRLVEPNEIAEAVRWRLGRERGDLAGRTVAVTAGGTREAIDPVRYLSNHSSGKQGYALAEAARDRGAHVLLISTVDRPPPVGVELIAVDSHADMQAALTEACDPVRAAAEVVLMAGAVADYSPADPAERKIKRGDRGGDPLIIELAENADIIANLDSPAIKVAFAAETDDLIENAAHKLRAKGARLIVANDVTATDAGFGVDTNRVTILDDTGQREDLPLMSKYDVAMRVLDRVAQLLD